MRSIASHYSKSKTTKQLLSGHTNPLGMGVYGEGGDPQSLSPTPTNGGPNPQVGGKTVPYVGRFLPSKKMESMTGKLRPHDVFSIFLDNWFDVKSV